MRNGIEDTGYREAGCLYEVRSLGDGPLKHAAMVTLGTLPPPPLPRASVFPRIKSKSGHPRLRRPHVEVGAKRVPGK